MTRGPAQGAERSAASSSRSGRWSLRVDTGGTFTDCVAVAPDGRTLELKVLSSSALRASILRSDETPRVELGSPWDLPEGFFAGYRLRPLGQEPTVQILDSGRGGRSLTLAPAHGLELFQGQGVELLSPEEAPLLAARVATGTLLHAQLPPIDLRLGTTRGTNALLERSGARTALFLTKGFADLLRIGTQQRPDLFALDVQRPEPLAALVLEVDERLDADGAVLQGLDTARLDADIATLRSKGIEAVAVALLHAYRDPVHERMVEERARAAGFQHVSRSSAVAPFQQLLGRARTSVVDAYLAPIIEGYLGSIARSLGSDGQRIHVMTSAGGLVSRTEYRPKDSLLSGPAAGVVGAVAAGRAAGFARLLSLDMGGTSTDVARIDGDFEYVFEHEVGGAELMAPALAIETVAAGGGSICGVEHGRLVVGPRSAGAFPGSACYGAGGPLTLTDVNLLLGRIRAERLPIPIDRDAAARRLHEEVDALRVQTGEPVEPDALLEGWLRIANERMAEAIRQISVRRGYDPRDHALLAFGGAGGQHACAIAELLDIRTILAPPSAGILSAMGLHHARLERFAERQVLEPLEVAGPRLDSMLAEMEARAIRSVIDEGLAPEDVRVERRLLEMRYVGQDSTLVLEYEGAGEVADRFARRYLELFAHRPVGKPIELVCVRVIARASGQPGVVTRETAPGSGARDRARALSRGAWIEIDVHERADLVLGAVIRGPALVVEDHALFFLEQGWSAAPDSSGCVVATRDPGGAREGGEESRDASAPAAVTLELFRHRFASIAREMGEHLRRTAISTNIKERLDFSCALLDAEGRLVVNAPHIPVHLGALGLCVRTLRSAIDLGAGDVVVTNHPAFGGSHLPDLTVVSAIFDASGRRLGHVAVRAHHAEIGGTTPGSMPPDATALAEEGVVLPPLYLVRGGQPDFGEVERRLSQGPHPTRALPDNLADLQAMVAATSVGVERLRELAATHTPEVVAGQMDALRALALRHVQSALRELGDGRYGADDAMDDGSPIRVAIDVLDGRARVDFSGSAPVHAGNLNATAAIVRSAVLYVFRLLVREPLPLNEGLMEAIELVLPVGMLNPGFAAAEDRCPAIVGGNVETSQRIVDVLLRAFGVVAASQGTMNNVTFGNARFGYYETLGGGAGAGPGFHGASGVHSHMTNTRLTDVEVLEHRYPVRVRRLALRPGSGGAGRWRGGDGLVRELEFLEPVTLSVLTQRRDRGPWGAAGGESGQPGRQFVQRVGAAREPLRALDRVELDAGDRFVIETPGGGGYGVPGAEESDR